MTVLKVREQLEKIPDDMEVVVLNNYLGGCDELKKIEKTIVNGRNVVMITVS